MKIITRLKRAERFSSLCYKYTHNEVVYLGYSIFLDHSISNTNGFYSYCLSVQQDGLIRSICF